MKSDRKSDREFQIELLKVQVEMESWTNWFITIFVVLISLITTPWEIGFGFRYALVITLVGLTMTLAGIQPTIRKQKLSALKKKFLGE